MNAKLAPCKWDHDAVYKPFVIYDERQWLPRHNGRKGGVEQIGLALHDGENLGF
jgi:beta-1,2-mannobiose phosphorylase / 1,2-beta-oligomannan phosphorylase